MKPLIVANWKCNPTTLSQAKRLYAKVKKYPAVVCPPFPYLSALFANGAQDVFWEDSGAYTGEVSPAMLKDLGVKYVIVGHSERRKYQKETNEMVFRKMRAAVGAGLKPIVCIDKVSQLPGGLREDFIVAYEPLFAIGTGNPCTVSKAGKMYLAIRKIVGKAPPILYGGSVNAANAAGYVKEAGFQGLLVGGASLKPEEFIGIIKSVY